MGIENIRGIGKAQEVYKEINIGDEKELQAIIESYEEVTKLLKK